MAIGFAAPVVDVKDPAFELDFVGVPLLAYPDGNLSIMGMRKAPGCRLADCLYSSRRPERQRRTCFSNSSG